MQRTELKCDMCPSIYLSLRQVSYPRKCFHGSKSFKWQMHKQPDALYFWIIMQSLCLARFLALFQSWVSTSKSRVAFHVLHWSILSNCLRHLFWVWPGGSPRRNYGTASQVWHWRIWNHGIGVTLTNFTIVVPRWCLLSHISHGWY